MNPHVTLLYATVLSNDQTDFEVVTRKAAGLLVGLTKVIAVKFMVPEELVTHKLSLRRSEDYPFRFDAAILIEHC